MCFSCIIIINNVLSESSSWKNCGIFPNGWELWSLFWNCLQFSCLCSLWRGRSGVLSETLGVHSHSAPFRENGGGSSLGVFMSLGENSQRYKHFRTSDMWNTDLCGFSKSICMQVCKSLLSDPQVTKLGGLSFYWIQPSFGDEMLTYILIF